MSQSSIPIFSIGTQQRRAAEMPAVSQAPITVFGGSGTGKTHTCLARVRHLLDSGVEPRHIAYLSVIARMAVKFRELLDRLPPEYSGPAQDIFVGTPEQIAVRYLRVTGAALGILPEFSLWNLTQAAEVISASWGQGEDEERLDDATINQILGWDALGRDLVGRRRTPPRDQLWGRVLGRYASEKQACQALGVPDVKRLAVEAMEQRPELGRVFAGECTLHLLVDGVQDLTPVDRALLDRLIREDGSLLVTCDPNQAISSPVGADIQDPWPDPEAWELGSRHTLPHIHGATEPLAQAARRLAASPSMTGLSSYHQTEVRVIGGSPPVVRRFDSGDEADSFLLQQLNRLHDAGTNWSETAVICRDPADVPRLRALLECRSIPCEAWCGAQDPPDQTVRRVVGLIASVLNPLDVNAFAAAAFGEDARNWVVERHVMETLKAIVREQDVDLFQAARQLQPNFQPDGVVHNSLDRMMRAREALYLSSRDHTLEELCRTAMALVGVSPDDPSPGLPRLLEMSKSSPNRGWNFLWDRAVEFLDRVNPDLYPGALSPGGAVTVTTIEEARGLEWPRVFVLDADLPQEERSQGEEQRMRYIALTRATHQLYYLVPLDRSNRVFPNPWRVADRLEHPDVNLGTGSTAFGPGEGEGLPEGPSTGIR